MLRLIQGSLLITMLSLNVLSANFFKNDDVFDQFRDLDRNKGTFLYFTDIYTCIGCNTDDLTNTIRTNAKINPEQNHILVVRLLQKEEISFFNKKFSLKYVMADPDGSLTKAINPTFKTSIYLDSLSFIDNVSNDFRAAPQLSTNSNNSTDIKEIRINDLDQPIIVAFHSIFQIGSSTLTILDDLQNAIFFVDINTGNIIHKFEDDGTLKYFFFKDTANNKWKKRFDEIATPVIANLYMDPRSRQINSLVMAYSIEKKIKLNKEKSSNDTIIVFMPKMINIKFINYGEIIIDTVAVNADYSIYKNMIGCKSGIICERENQIKAPHDSLVPVLFHINNTSI